MLQDTQWLGDEHIQRDYDLLAPAVAGEPSGSRRPDAARGSSCSPLSAGLAATDSEARRDFQLLIDRNGDATADFLFLPMNNADRLNERRTHWSLLFVDRSNGQRPLAYHYDSIPGSNQARAVKFAERLGLSLRPACIAQQQNSYDCGVFVVDGTRALVRELAHGQHDLRIPMISPGCTDLISPRIPR
ncbi:MULTISPECIES: Ulp1 family isopeptidase [unclassified Bradyrhizobium]